MAGRGLPSRVGAFLNRTAAPFRFRAVGFGFVSLLVVGLVLNFVVIRLVAGLVRFRLGSGLVALPQRRSARRSLTPRPQDAGDDDPDRDCDDDIEARHATCPL